MAVSLRNRWTIGAIVLIALLIVFVPLFTRAPPIATVQPLSIPLSPLRPHSDQLIVNTKSDIKDAFLSFLPATKAWTIQLTDFKSPSAADIFVKRLRNKGFKAYFRQINTLSGPVTRVFVGPELKMDKINSLVEQLKKEVSAKATVVTFNPLLIQ